MRGKTISKVRALSFALILLLLAGCGGGGGNDNAEGSPTPRVTPTPTAAPPRAWAVGVGDILRSEDGGLTWSTLATFPDPIGPEGVHFVDRMNGWAVGAIGLILHTTDGGDSFSDQSQNVAGLQRPPYLLDVVFMDAQRGVAVGSHGAPAPISSGPPLILRTADAGAHWAPAAIAGGTNAALEMARLHSVCFTTSGIGLATGTGVSGDLVLLSQDVGASWFDITDRVTASGGAACVGNADLWIVQGSAITHSSDGGTTWIDRSDGLPAEPLELHDVAFADPLTGWVVGNRLSVVGSDAVLHTVGGGAHWTETALPATDVGGLSVIAFASTTTGITAGLMRGDATGRLAIGFATQDGGSSWTASSFPPGAGPITGVSLVP